MSAEYKAFRICFLISRAFISIFYRYKVFGAENIPENAAVICANHSSNLDPFLVAYAFGVKHHMHILAKAELFKIPLISQILRKIGMIRVDRDSLDVTSVKTALSYLKNGEKILIFPEGTRVSDQDSVSAKTGAVKIAQRAAVPIIPVYLPRKKTLFGQVPVVIGEPYFIEKSSDKRQTDDYVQLSEAMMDSIMVLKDKIR